MVAQGRGAEWRASDDATETAWRIPLRVAGSLRPIGSEDDRAVSRDERLEVQIAKVRQILAEYEAGKRTLPVLLGEVKELSRALPASDALWQSELESALRGVTAAFGERISPGPGTTMTLDAEHRLHDAVADLKRVLLRGAA